MSKSSNKMFSRRTWLIIAGIAAILFFIWWRTAPETPRGPAGARPQPVRVATATQGNFEIVIAGIGTVTAESSVTVRTRVDGQLMALYFTEGQMVKAGDLLAQIDPRPYEVQLTQAKGQMSKDQALLTNAKQDLARYTVLRRQESTSQQQVDSQQSLVRQYEAALKTDQGQIDAAQLQLTYSRITAPIDGRLGIRLVDPGNILHASDTNGIIVITKVHPISVIFTITEQQVPEVLAEFRAGKKLTVEAWDREQKTRLAVGYLKTTDNLIDVSTGTLRMKAEFSNEDDKLFPNQFVNARLMVRTLENAIKIPASALQNGSQGPYVFTVANGKAVMRKVTPGAIDKGVVHIREGVANGDVVVIDGVDRLRDGSPVSFPGMMGEGASGRKQAGAQGDGRGGGKGGQAPEGHSDGNTPMSKRERAAQ